MLEFIANIGGYAVLGSALFWSAVGYAWTAKTCQVWWWGVLAGALLHGLGVLILVIVHFGRRASIANRRVSAVEPEDVFADSAFEGNDPFGAAEWLDDQPAQHGKFPRASDSGLTSVIAPVIIMVAAVAALALPFYYLLSGGSETPVYAFGTSLDFWIFFSAVLLGLGAALSQFGRPLVASILFAWVGAWWLQLSVAALLDREAFLAASMAVYQLPDLYVTGYDENGQFVSAYANQAGQAWYLMLAIGLASWGLSLWTSRRLRQN